jgi:hypothetical protein
MARVIVLVQVHMDHEHRKALNRLDTRVMIDKLILDAEPRYIFAAVGSG